MKVKVLKGTNQIGGCISEISTDQAKIIIDFGNDLDNEMEDKKTIEIEGLTYGKSKYDAVFITHSHNDHIGLVNKINLDIAVFIEEKTFQIYEVTCDFTDNDKIKRKVHLFKLDEVPIIIKDMVITPYIVDHSSYHSCMFLIENEGKKILHTGDFRQHGRVGSLLKKNLEKIGRVDGLIIEGTTLSRKKETSLSEFALEKVSRRLFQEYDQVFILMSSTNIDRIVSFYKARGNKKMVFDTFTSAITNKLEHIPNITYPDIYHWDPCCYQRKKEKEFTKKYMGKHNKEKYGFLPNFIMLVKPSMAIELKKFKKLGMIKGKTLLLYSMWDGYIKKDKKLQKFIEDLKKIGMDFKILHTSGHADFKTLQMVEDRLNPKMTIVIHTTGKKREKLIFKKYVELLDNMEVEI